MLLKRQSASFRTDNSRGALISIGLEVTTRATTVSGREIQPRGYPELLRWPYR